MARVIDPDLFPRAALDLSAAQQQRFARYLGEHKRQGQFFTPWRDRPKPAMRDILTWQLGAKPYAARKKTTPRINVETRPLERWRSSPGELRVMWLGHASFLIELNERRFLIDPLFGDVSPLVKRHAPRPLAPGELPRIDAVLLTHGHYDHMDIRSLAALLKLQPECPLIVPLGQARYMPRAARRVMEVDWWQQLMLDDVRLTFLPAQHWHQRGPLDYNAALWGGWWLEGECSVYHMGDSGAFGGFEAVRDVMGRPDVMMLPVGAYEPRWFMAPQHMDPQAALEVWDTMEARYAVLMHYNTFDLSDEPLDMGPEELRAQIPHGDVRHDRLIELEHGGTLSLSRGVLQR